MKKSIVKAIMTAIVISLGIVLIPCILYIVLMKLNDPNCTYGFMVLSYLVGSLITITLEDGCRKGKEAKWSQQLETK